jgi:hypothetical protein
MVFLPNPPVKDAAMGEADKSLRLSCEIQNLFHQELCSKNNPPEADKSSEYKSYACLSCGMRSIFHHGGYVFISPI